MQSYIMSSIWVLEDDWIMYFGKDTEYLRG